MSKLLSVLIAAFFAAGAFAQTPSISPTSGAASTSNATSTNNNTNTNTNTNTNNVNVYGPGSNKLARQQRRSGATGVSMLPGKGHGDRTASTGGDHNRLGERGTRTADRGARSGERYASNSRSCPPGLAKKNNGCMPPGLARHDRNDSHVMGSRGDRFDRDHDRLAMRHDRDHDHDHDRHARADHDRDHDRLARADRDRFDTRVMGNRGSHFDRDRDHRATHKEMEHHTASR